MNNVTKMLFNKVTFFTVIINWGLIAIVLYNRGYFSSPIHHETIFFDLVLILNLPAISFAGLIQPIPLTIANYSSDIVLILTASITAQWWIIGFFIKQMFFNRKVKVLTNE